MTKPLAKLEFKRLRDLFLRPESGVTGHPSMEQGDVSVDDEVANFLPGIMWTWFVRVTRIMSIVIEGEGI
jgi:hypothetical protein